MNPVFKELIVWFAIYMIGVLVAYFIFCYRNAKRSYKNEYEVKLSENELFTFIFWPLIIFLGIFVIPFKLIEKLALKIKRIANPIEIQAKDIIK